MSKKTKKNGIKDVIISPVGTSIWLIDNTGLTFNQIAAFCDIPHEEIVSIADGIIGKDIIPVDPILNGTLTRTEIQRCEADPKATLKNCFHVLDNLTINVAKLKKYTPLLHRRSRADSILWLLNFCPELTNPQIVRLLSTTTNLVQQIRDKVYKNYAHLIPKDPVIIGFCTQQELDREIAKHRKDD